MNYDCIIIGGGLSGLTCGIKCAQEGLRPVIISGGMSALHFSSGSIDLMGLNNKNNIIEEPMKYLKEFIKNNPSHPYSAVGMKTIKDSLTFFQEQMHEEGLHLFHNNSHNHMRITNFGIPRPTYFSQTSVYNERLKKAIEDKEKIALLNFKGYRDYYPELARHELEKNPFFKDIEFITGEITLPHYTGTQKNLHEYRSFDLSRVFETEKYLPRIANEIKRAAGDALIVSLPAFIGIQNFTHIHEKLEAMTGKIIYEVPSLPPSLPGMRIDTALKSRFAHYGGEMSISEKIISGDIDKNILKSVHSENNPDIKLKAPFFVLATGSFFSGGLRSEYNRLSEPVFGLEFKGNNNRSSWYAKDFFDKKSHPFLEMGVDANKSLNPVYNKKTVKNLFCTGALLADYNPIKEASGGGVAIATGYYAAQKIITSIKGSS